MYLFPTPAFMYTASIIIGIGAAVIWTAQGDFLGMQSPTDKLMMRNTGIFWVLFQFSLIIGNSYIYLAWTGKDNVGRTEINLLFTGLSILGTDFKNKNRFENRFEHPGGVLIFKFKCEISVLRSFNIIDNKYNPERVMVGVQYKPHLIIAPQ